MEEDDMPESACTNAELAYMAGERRLARIATVGAGGTPHTRAPLFWPHMLLGVVERSSRHSEAQDPGPQARCVCGEKVTIADAREVTLPNGRPGWEGRCPECGAPLFAIRRKPPGG